MHLFSYLLLALSLNTCLRAVQTIATYIEVINAFQVLKMFSFFRRFTCVIFAHAINTDVWHAIEARATEVSDKNCSDPNFSFDGSFPLQFCYV